jgi:DNA-binding XRE family transcriptional regulator
MKPEDFKKWRTKMEWSQTEAANQLGVTRQTIVNYERGHTSGKEEKHISIPRYIELACAALAANISGYQPDD